jgi:hypothetical protein
MTEFSEVAHLHRRARREEVGLASQGGVVEAFGHGEELRGVRPSLRTRGERRDRHPAASEHVGQCRLVAETASETQRLVTERRLVSVESPHELDSEVCEKPGAGCEIGSVHRVERCLQHRHALFVNAVRRAEHATSAVGERGARKTARVTSAGGEPGGLEQGLPIGRLTGAVLGLPE